MKKQNKIMEFLNSKGFYTALFTSLFAVLAIAAFVSIKNIDAITKLNTAKPVADPTYGEQDQLPELAEASVKTESPLVNTQVRQSSAPNTEAPPAPADTASTTAEKKTESIKVEVREAPKTETKPQEDAPKPKPDGGTASENLQDDKEAPPTGSSEAGQNESAAKREADKKETAPAENNIKPPAETNAANETSAAPKGLSDASWPLDGAIVMNFSMDKTIYDKTLDQYRTNASVSIGADSGTQVKAAADGVVKSVSIDPRTGLTLVIDHGDGWETKYGQLQETVLVKEGQTVKAGQAIGGVGNPTKYAILLGSHLDFGVTKDDVPQNPQVVLAN